ncbi:MAG: hypothetical protein Q8P73_04060 [bacterium]|nr:hypothetical protein [bacterium]
MSPRQHYEDLFDRITVDSCREIERIYLGYEFDPDKKSGEVPSQAAQDAIRKMNTELRLMWEIGKRYSKREQTINDWIDGDKAKDEMLENAQPPRGIRCNGCAGHMTPSMKTLYDLFNSPDRVLFFFDCDNGCKEKRAMFENGDEYKPKPYLCPDCGSELDDDSERKGDVITTSYKCSDCGHAHKEEMDMTPKKEAIDPNFEKDRKRFCPTGKKAERYVQGVQSMHDVSRLVTEWRQKDKDRPYYDEINKMNKLTVPQLGVQLNDAMKDTGFIKLELSPPDVDQQVVVSFSVQDERSDREGKSSEYDFKRLLKQFLANTNWRLMSDGVHYRLGVLTGRLKGYDREADMMELAKQRLKKGKP